MKGSADVNDVIGKKPELKKEYETLAKAVLGIERIEFKETYRFYKDTPLWKRFIETINIFKHSYIKDMQKEPYCRFILHKNGMVKEIPLKNHHINKILNQTKTNYKKGVCKSVETYLYENGLKLSNRLYEHKN